MAVFLAATIAGAWWLTPQRPNSLFAATQPSEVSPSGFQSLTVLAAQSHLRAGPKKPWHPVYNHSVIPGGVHNAYELREIVGRDSTVAAHYAGFKYDRARIVRLRKPVLVYLSYRKNGAVYWTRAKHRLAAGDQLITDGEMAARTRCGNRVSVRQQMGVSPDEPTEAELNQIINPLLPPVDFQVPVQYQTALLPQPDPDPAAPWVGPGGGPGPLPIYPAPIPTGGGGCIPTKDNNCQPPPPPPVPTVPEPGTLMLFGSGLIAVYAAYRRKSRHD